MTQLGDLVDKVEIELQDSANTYFSAANVKNAIGNAYQFYTMKAIDEGTGWFESVANLAITGGTETVSLTSLNPTFFQVSDIKKNTATGRIPLRNRERRYTYDSTLGVGSADTYLPDYKLRGTNLVLLPQPQSSESASDTTGLRLEYNYLPTFPDASSANSFEFDANFPTSFDPMIVLWATIEMLEYKDGMGTTSDINSFRMRLQKWEELFMNSLSRDETPDEIQYYGYTYY